MEIPEDVMGAVHEEVIAVRHQKQAQQFANKTRRGNFNNNGNRGGRPGNFQNRGGYRQYTPSGQNTPQNSQQNYRYPNQRGNRGSQHHNYNNQNQQYRDDRNNGHNQQYRDDRNNSQNQQYRDDRHNNRSQQYRDDRQ